MLDSFLSADHALLPVEPRLVALALLLSFVLGQTIAWVYMATHDGLSYSRAFVVSLIILPVIVTLVMLVLSNSLVTAFGLMAVFAIVRFRNILRDTLDTAHVLAGIVLGMACGTMKFATAVLGGAIIVGLLIYARVTHFGRRHTHDFILHLEATGPADASPTWDPILARHTRSARCVQRRNSPDSVQLSYHLALRNPERSDDLLCELAALPAIREATGLAAEQQSEV